MTVKNTTSTWGWPARVLHWVMAVMIIGLVGMGTYISNFETDLVRQFQLIQDHKSFGFAVFVLALLRVAWRFANRDTPGLPADMPSWQVRASHASHYLLYALIFIMPLSGWLMSTASPLNDPNAYPVQVKNMVFGLFEMPDPFPTGSKSISDVFHVIHSIAGKFLAFILVVHTAAALKHHFVDKDTILKRMTFG
ncbi:MAG: cytochrome b [Pseudomonadota bacterium]